MSTRSGPRAAVGHSATGTFAELPLAHALVYIRAKRLSGVLDVRAPEQRHGWVVFWRGNVVSVTTTPTVARFGTVVYELGLVDATRLDETTAASQRERRPQADILVERGIITPSQYRQVLEEQMRRRVHHLFTYPRSTIFLFREGRTSATSPAVMIDVLAPVWRGIKDYPPKERVAEVLALIGDRPIEMLSEAALELAELSGAEARVCNTVASRPSTLSELRDGTTLPADRIDLLAYLLVIARCAAPRGEGKAPATSGAMWPAARPATTPSGESPAALGRSMGSGELPRVRGPAELGADEIKTRASRLEDESPFDALGIPHGASVEAARAAFFRLSRLWHPDRLPAELAPVRSDVERIFRHMSEAHRLLTDDRKGGRASGQ